MKKYTFRRWLRSWLTDFDTNQEAKIPIGNPLYEKPIRQHDEPETDNCLNFRVWFANGGRVVQVNRYDRRKDQSNTNLYVVTPDKNFGEEVDKIITMEGLRG